MRRGRPAIAWVEEWMSWRAFNILPALAEHFDITYVTTGTEVPPAQFHQVLRFPPWKHMMLAGFTLSRCVDRLYREGRVELAVVYGSVGFAIRSAPFVTIEGGSVYRETQILSRFVPWTRRARFPLGFVHYVLPEIVCTRRARRVIAISHSLKQDLIALHRLPPDRVSVVYNGIGQEYLDVFPRRRPSARPKALYVGRLHFRKGILQVLQELVRRPELAVDFLVAGDGPDRPAIERLAAADKRIVYVGHANRAQLLDLFATSQVFVFPTYYEGFGSALVEAMASGLTCLSYETPITREILGDAGITVPLGDASALVERLAWIVNDPAGVSEYGTRAHERARQYSWDAYAAQIGAILQDELDGT